MCSIWILLFVPQILLVLCFLAFTEMSSFFPFSKDYGNDPATFVYSKDQWTSLISFHYSSDILIL